MTTPVVLAGVGGLGSHVVMSVARLAPVTIELWDPGVVDAPDLNRQILYQPQSEGRSKCEVATEELRRINPDLTIHAHPAPISAATFVPPLLPGRDPTGAPPFVLFDCLDSFSARAELELIRRYTGCTVIHGGVEGWYGQATTFPGSGPGYVDAFGPDFADTPAAAKPILPTTVAIIAALQVGEYLHLFSAAGFAEAGTTPLTGAFGVYDGHRATIDRLEYHR